MRLAEIHVDFSPGEIAIELGVEVDEGSVQRGESLPIHIFAGENVCIQRISPAQSGFA